MEVRWPFLDLARLGRSFRARERRFGGFGYKQLDAEDMFERYLPLEPFEPHNLSACRVVLVAEADMDACLNEMGG